MFGYGSLPPFLQIIQPGGSVNYKKSIQIEQPILTQQQKDSLPQNIRQVYQSIFTQQPKDLDLKQKIPFQIKITQMPVCNKTFENNEVVYKCHTCMIHDAAVQCAQCFEQSDHKGHRYEKIQAGGGNCDCGNGQSFSITGACKRHPGKANPVEIQAQIKQQFLQYFRYLFQWYFKLVIKHTKKGDVLGSVIARYLTHLNTQSLYYNTLTAELLYQMQTDEQSNRLPRIEKIFRTNSPVACRHFCKLTLEMFSLEQFKFKLTKSYIKAYNTVKNFQTSDFKDLFIQLMANHQILQKCMKEGVFLNIYQTNRKYNQDKYLDNLMYMTSIKKETIESLLKNLISVSFMKTQVIENFQASLKKGNSYQGQVSTYVNEQNYFQLVTEKVFQIIHTIKDTLKIYINKLIDQILLKEDFYKKNKIILPYHRILAMALFSFFDGQIMNIEAKDVMQRLGIQEEKLIKILKQCAQSVIRCFWQFSLSFCRRSYFDSYVHLYTQSGVITVKHDILLLRICCYFLNKLGKEKIIEDSILKLLQNQWLENPHIKQAKQEQKPQKRQGQGFPFLSAQQQQRRRNKKDYQRLLDEQILQFYSRASYFLGMLVETTISQRQELMFSHDILIKNQHLNQRSQKLIQSYLNLTKQVTIDDNKLFTKHFLANQYNQQIMNQLVQFNQETKKLKPRKTTNDILNLCFYQSLAKVRNFFPKQLEEAVPNQIEISKFNSIVGEVLLGQNLLERFIYIQQVKIKDEKTMNNLIRQLAKVCFVMPKSKHIIKGLVQRIRNTPLLDSSFLKNNYFRPFCKSLEILIDQEGQLAIKQQKQLQRKKHMKEVQLKKIKEMKQKQNKFKIDMEIHQGDMDVELQTNQSIDKCLICQDIDPNKILCSVIKVSIQNFYLNQIGLGGKQTMISMTSCNHQIHYECYCVTFAAKQFFHCPLCKKVANNVLPIPQVIETANKQIIENCLDRIDVVKSTLTIDQFQYSGYEKIQQQLPKIETEKQDEKKPSEKSKLVFDLLLSFTQLVGFRGLQNNIKFTKIHSKLAKTIIMILKKYMQFISQDEKKSITQFSIAKMEQWSKKQSNEDLSIFQLIFQIGYQIILAKEILEIKQSLKQNQSFNQLPKALITLIESLIFKSIQPTYQPSMIEEQLPNQRWSLKLKQRFCPPDSIEDLMKNRDANLSNCKNGHQIAICCLCGEFACLDCRKHYQHTKEMHAKKSIYFSYMTGALTYDIGTMRNQTRTLYQNEIGKGWKPTFEPKGYSLDRIAYKKLIEQIIQCNFQEKIKGSPIYFRHIEEVD